MAWGRKAREIARLEAKLTERADLARQAVDHRDALIAEARRQLEKRDEWDAKLVGQLEDVTTERDEFVRRIAEVSGYDLVISMSTMRADSTGFGRPERVDELVRAPLDVLASIVAGSDSPEGRSLLSGSYRGKPLPQLVYEPVAPDKMRFIDVGLWQRPEPYEVLRAAPLWGDTLLADEDDRDEVDPDA